MFSEKYLFLVLEIFNVFIYCFTFNINDFFKLNFDKRNVTDLLHGGILREWNVSKITLFIVTTGRQWSTSHLPQNKIRS